MQIVEVSPFGARAARIGLGSATSTLEVTLFPMVHIGEAAFYDAVYADALDHDVVLMEGVSSSLARRLTRSYRWATGSRRLGLQLQSSYRPPPKYRAKVIHADLSGPEFLKAWLEIPWHLRALIGVLAPLVGLQLRWFGTRETLARGLPLDDRTSRDEWLDWDPEFAAFTRALLDVRDQRLLSVLAGVLDSIETPVRRVAIVYGAWHMRAVLRELSRRGFHATSTQWQTIFSLD